MTLSPMTLSPLAPLAEQLVAEFGHVVPATLVRSTVTAATDGRGAADDVGSAARTARADVEALAEAITRRATTGTISA